MAQNEETPDSDSERTVRRLGDVEAEEYQLNLSIPEAAGSPDSRKAFSLPDPEQNARLEKLISNLAARPGNRAATTELIGFLATVLDDANAHMDMEELEEAARLLGVVRNVNPRQAGLPAAERRLVDLRQIHQWLSSADAAFRNEMLIEPAGNSAMHYYSEILSMDPHYEEGLKGLIRVQQGLVAWALEDARNLDFEGAESLLEAASTIRPQQDVVIDARAEIAEFRAQKALSIEQDIIRAIQGGDYDYAEFTLIDLIALGGHEDKVAELRERLNRERIYGQWAPGQVIQDQLPRAGGVAPAVIVLPPGSFMMGSPERDRNGEDSERPQHRVSIERSFGVGLQEVTVSQFRTFIEASGYQTNAEAGRSSRVWDESLGRLTERERVNWRHDFQGKRARDEAPVLHVSWNDAQAYVRWLSEETGVAYRLPTEAEWEFAIRAGTTTNYWWGDGRPKEPVENLTGSRDESETGRSFSTSFRSYGDEFWGPSPAGSFMANSLGLYDMAGNVSEWVQDCWHSNYMRAPRDGSAWENPGCERRVVRGGYWAAAPGTARSSARNSASPGLHGPQVGIRVARDL